MVVLKVLLLKATIWSRVKVVPGPGTASSLKVVLLKATMWSKVKVVPDPGMSSGVGGSSSSGEEGELLLFPSSSPR